MNHSVCILLAAGFSAPMGYPVGGQLGDKLLSITKDDYSWSSDGRMMAKTNTSYRNSYQISFEFCLLLIHYWHKQNGYFDYEQFYDFMIHEAEKDQGVAELAKPYAGKDKAYLDLHQLLFSLKNIYAQLVSAHIRDRDGEKWYNYNGYSGPGSYPEYAVFVEQLKRLGEAHQQINIHTLNHDLFFERLYQTEYFDQPLSDGFTELGSPFYAGLSSNGNSYSCRMPYYSGQYEGKYRLFKLHGSFDYAIYYEQQGNTAIRRAKTYVKTTQEIGFSRFSKEIVGKDKKRYYDECWINYHADFLTGTTSKILRYKEPILYNKLFRHFATNLKKASSLIIIGYGGADREVNRIILKHFDYKNKPSYIIDLFAGQKVVDLQLKLNAKLIRKSLKDITTSDLS